VKFVFSFLVSFILLAAPVAAQFQSEEESRSWTLDNGVIRSVFALSSDGEFRLVSLTRLASGKTWRPSQAVSLFRIRTSRGSVDENTRFDLIEHSHRAIARQGMRQTIVLEDRDKAGRLSLELEMFAGQPVLRYRTVWQNRGPNPVWAQTADPLPWSLEIPDESVRVFRVNQWANHGRDANFEPTATTLRAGSLPVNMVTGAYGRQCTWLAVRDSRDEGLFLGWEFDGRMDVSIFKSPALQISSSIRELNREISPNGSFPVPAAFIGLFGGDWDEAGYRTQRFVEAAVAQPARDPNFPYVMWDSWGYQQNIDDVILRQNAEIAARIGVELFVVDLGWARQIGDWRPDPRKFPNGLRPLSDYVHSLGMRFGIHFPFAEAAPTSPVILANRDWMSPVDYQYFNARSLCLAHRPARDWLIAEAIRMIDEINPDWILTDGENMVKHCDKRTHTHDPADSNYANAVDGINFVVSAIQQRRPNVRWENCQNGGNMMTYSMVRRHVTSITSDDSGDITTRQAIFGATYPFPPRYTDRYMPHNAFHQYNTRSYMFGGPWIFMNQLPFVKPEELDLAAREIAIYKRLRGRIRDSKVLHLSARPSELGIDAIGAWHPPSDTAVVFVYRAQASPTSFRVRLRDLSPEKSYRIRFENSHLTYDLTGSRIATAGIQVPLTSMWYAEILYVEPATPNTDPEDHSQIE